MPSKGEFRKRFLTRLVASPTTLGPFLAGVTALLLKWAFDIDADWITLAGLAAILTGGGVCATRFLFGSGKVAEEVFEELQKEKKCSQTQKLDDLECRLKEDNDPRDEELLRELRELMRVFKEDGNKMTSTGYLSTDDIMTKINQLFDGCVKALESSYALSKTARRLGTKRSNADIQERRERIIKQVNQSIKRMRNILIHLQSIDLDDEGQTSQLDSLSQELDQSLKIAEQVEREMRGLGGEPDNSEYEQE